MLRNCYVCKEKKDEVEFIFQPTIGKYMTRCKTCNNKRTNKRIYEMPVEERRAMWRKQRAASDARHPERVAARVEVRKALKRGDLVQLPCEVCQEPKTQAHHDDHSKPLEVRWLCHQHHRDTHFKRRFTGTTT